MLDNKKLLYAMTEIDDDFIQSAEKFQENKIIEFRKRGKKWVAVAAIAVVLIGTTGYGAAELFKQLHMSAYYSVEELMNQHGIEVWDFAIPIAESTFDESVFDDLTPAEALIDILVTGKESISNKYTLEEGNQDSKWLRKLSGTDKYGYYEAYDYAKLSDTFSEHNLHFNMSYIEEQYTTVAGEYGCDYLYEDVTKENCLQYRMFSGYVNEAGNFVSVQYTVNYEKINKDPYILFEGDAKVRYYVTADGVAVFMKQGVGTEGGKHISAEVYTEHGHFCVGMYGEFEKEEVEAILDSLKIAEGMGIKVE